MAALLPIASQRGGTARFDVVHQPELMERQSVLLAVSRAVEAEDAGHLEGGPGHGGYWPSAGFGSVFFRAGRRVLSGGFFRARSSGLAMADRVRGVTAVIAGGGVDAAVAQQHLNGAGIGSVLQQVSRETMAQSMRSDAFFDAGHAAGVAADLLDSAGLDVGSGRGAGEQIVFGMLDFPVPAKQFQQGLAEYGVTVFGAFAFLDADRHSVRIDMCGFQRDRLGDAQAGTVTEHQDGAVFENADVPKQAGYLGLAQHHRQLFRDFHAHEAAITPGHFERNGVEKLHGRYERIDAGRG
ncbi:MAG TPA: hypothetical protein VFC21_02540 [Bryobacteraceae bacterium]|nr:hypothetical protein [Bryobacteraceae bacterium]